jgi:hypothetical protein
MNQKWQELVSALRAEMETMQDEERIKVMETLMRGYCSTCGRKEGSHETCACWNDE